MSPDDRLTKLLEIKPNELPDDIWDRLKTDSQKAEFIKDYPHPPVVGTFACAGSVKNSTPKNHVFKVVGLEFYWDTTSFVWGIWQSRSTDLTDWVPASDVPKRIEFLGQETDVVLNPNAHGTCPQCSPRKKQ